MIDLALRGVGKTFGSTRVVDDVSFEVRHGEWLSLLGPSGCGKTTTLRMIAGFFEPSHGVIEIRGRDVTGEPPYRRNTGMVFQNYALFPHMTAAENIGYGLRIRKHPAKQITDKVEQMLALTRLERLGGRYPRELSGGQQQRVALARALAIEPDVLLLDEPLSNIDAKLRQELCIEMSELQRRLKITTVYVTHDQDEALSMSSRIAVMDRGRLAQIGTPVEIYEQPATRFVADFIGKINLLDGEIVMPRTNGAAAVRLRGAADGAVLHVRADRDWPVGAAVEVAVRPEIVELVRPTDGRSSEATEGLLAGSIRHAAFYGGEVGYQVALATGIAIAVSERNRRQAPLAPGDPVLLRIPGDLCFLLGNE